MEDFFIDAIDPIDRVDGKQKVTGGAKYAAEYKPAGLQYGVLVGSNIAKGTITAFDTKSAEAAPGVAAVLHYQNCPAVPGYAASNNDVGPGGLKVFASDKIYFDGQP